MEEKKNSNFVEREWNEEIEGELDEDGFFITPNGSFWDPDYVYFNREGFDKHGGRYDEHGEYIPGKGWDEENNCYESEKEDHLDDDDYDDEEEAYNKNFNFENDNFDDLEGDVFESDIMGQHDNILEIIEESTKDHKNITKEKKDQNKKEDKENNDDKDKENKVEKEENGKDKKEEKNKNNSREKNKPKKIIITRQNQEKYLDEKILDDIKKNSEDISNKNNVDENKKNEDNKPTLEINNSNKGNNNYHNQNNKKNFKKNIQNNNRNNKKNKYNYNNNFNNIPNVNPPIMYNPMMIGPMNPLALNQFQLMQLNNQMNKMKINQSQMPMSPMQINQINQFNQMNQINPISMAINNMNQINQIPQMARMPIPAPNQFGAQGMPIMPMPLVYPNPMLYQQIYQQNMMQENEIQRLNKNYEYQLKKHKEAELYKVVNDKKNNSNK